MSNKCAIWHLQPLVNPLTNRKIKKNGPKYMELVQECGPPPSPSRRRSPSPSSRSDQPLRPTELYCGNNARDEGLRNGIKILGTRYQCLKKGIGRGLNEPIFNYNDEYEPIDDIKIFCGNGNVLPQNKDRFGTRDECLRKGFGVGQKQKYTRDGAIQQGPVVLEDRGWYKVYLPSVLGPVDLGRLRR